MTDNRQFWIELRRALLLVLIAIDRFYLPDKFEEDVEKVKARKEQKILD